MADNWLPISGFEGVYEVSSAGEVRRLKGGFNTEPGKVLKPRRTKKGYVRVVLHDRGSKREASVHRLVAETFMPNGRSGELQINHLDGNPFNNRVENLEWCTNLENLRHAIEVLKRRVVRRGVANGNARLRPRQVVEIRAAQGQVTCTELARRYGVSNQLISAIWRRHVWRSVP